MKSIDNFVEDFKGKIFRLWLPDNAQSECYFVVINDIYEMNNDYYVNYSYVEDGIFPAKEFAKLSDMQLQCSDSDQDEQL